MSQLPPAKQSPHGTDSSTTPSAGGPGFEAAVHAFWEKNRNFILFVCAAVLLAIVAREGWQYYTAQKEKDVQQEYAKIADQPNKLAAFAEAHSGHALAGVAWLCLADENFSATDYQSAAANYQKAANNLKNDVLLGRAKLGMAMSQLNGGDKVAAETALGALSTDQSLLKAVRAEATYYLAALAAEAGKTNEVKKLVEEIGQIDSTGVWFQRATLLSMGQQASAQPAQPSIMFKPSGN